jgi:hypothetical protein
MAGVEMSEWQEWQSAPKDGQFFLAYFGDYFGEWTSHGDIKILRLDGSGDGGKWVNHCGEVVIREWKNDPMFTHWMPLPETPFAPPAVLHEYEKFDD